MDFFFINVIFKKGFNTIFVVDDINNLLGLIISHYENIGVIATPSINHTEPLYFRKGSLSNPVSNITTAPMA